MNQNSELIWQDTQHNILFKLIDELAEIQNCRHVIQQLKLYADHHFCLEEAYMVRLNYPGKDKHIAAHNRFREELAQLEYDATDNAQAPALQKAVSTFLREWLTRHIMSIDKDFEEFVLNSNYK